MLSLWLCSWMAMVAPATDSRPRVLILPPSSSSYAPQELGPLSGIIAAAVASDARLDVVTSEDVASLVALEGDRQIAGCDDNSCLAELAGAIGARYVVFGDISRLGDRAVANLRLFDTQTATALKRLSLTAPSLAALGDALRGPLSALGDSILPPAPAVPWFGAPATSDSTTAAPAAGDPPTGGPMMGDPTTGLILLGSGAAVAGLAGLADAFLPTSRNETLDAVDWVWPISYGVVGPVLAIVGAVFLFSSPPASGAPGAAAATAASDAP